VKNTSFYLNRWWSTL